MAEKSAYRSAFRHHRCLVSVDGFYEWAKANGAKQPHYFQLKDGGSFAFAGLWERWAKGGEADRILHAADDRGERCGEPGP